MKQRPGKVALSIVAAWVAGCASATSNPSAAAQHPSTGAVSAPSASSGAPTLPGSAQRTPIHFPETAEIETSSGVKVMTVVRPTDPLVEVRIIVASGSAADGEHPGRAAVTARLVADAVSNASPSPLHPTDPKARPFAVETHVDYVVFATTLLPDSVEPALVSLTNALVTPKVLAVDVKRIARVVSGEENARLGALGDAGERLVRRDLFLQPIGRHPYAVVHPSADDFAKIDAPSVNDCIRASYVASNMRLVVTGPIAGVDVSAIAERAFAHVSTARPAPLSIDDPIARPRPRRIMLVDSPSRKSVTITVGRLGPDLSDGESIATRLFGQAWIAHVVAAQKPEARPTFRLVPFREGPSLALFEASVSPGRASAVLAALLDHEVGGDVAPGELTSARAAFDDEIALDLAKPGYIADALATFAALGLSGSSLEKSSIEAATTPLESVGSAGRKLLAGDEVAVVVGDAKILLADLRRVGEIDILDPTHDFERVRTERQESATKLPTSPKKVDDSTMVEPPRP